MKTKDFAKGFLKAAARKNLTVIDLTAVIKCAFAQQGQLTYEDMDRMKTELADKGIQAPYEDNSGELSRMYNAKMLRERDSAADAIPEIEGGLAGLKAGITGAAVGGLGGTLAGNAIHHSGVLNLGHNTTKHLPLGLGVTAATLAGILSAMPKAKQKYEATKAFKKLHSPENLESLAQGNALDQQVMNT